MKKTLSFIIGFMAWLITLPFVAMFYLCNAILAPFIKLHDWADESLGKILK